MADELIYPEQQQQDALIYPEQDKLIYPEQLAPPKQPGLLEQTGTFLKENVVKPIAEFGQANTAATGRIAEAGYEAGKAALQLEKPLGEPEAEVQKVPILEAGPFKFPELQQTARGFGIAKDVIGRAMGALASGGLTAFNQALIEAGTDPQLVKDLTGMAEYELIKPEAGGGITVGQPGPRGSLGEQLAGEKVAEFTQQARESLARQRAAGEQVIRDPFDITKRLPTPGAPVTKTPEDIRSPFPNAATDDLSGLDLSGTQFAPELTAAPVPPMPPRPAAARPGGPVEPTTVPETPVKPTDVDKFGVPYPEGITEQQKKGIDKIRAQKRSNEKQREMAEKLRKDVETLKTRRASMTDKEKFEMAMEEQEAKQRAAPKKPTFKVIPGGKKDEPPGGLQSITEPPDPDAVPALPPEPGPDVVGPAQYSSLFADPGFDPGLSTGIAPKGVDLGNLRAITFGTPADIERWIPQVGERHVDLVGAKKEDFPIDAITATTEDLPTGAGEAGRVTGGTAKGRAHLRAAIDSVKLYRAALTLGNDSSAATALKQARDHYLQAVSTGVRVKPSGNNFILLEPGEHATKLVRKSALVAQRTTRTQATHYFIPELDNKGLMYFSTTAPRFGAAPGLSIDLGKLLDTKAVTALPWEVQHEITTRFSTTYHLGTDIDLATRALNAVGVYFTKSVSPLLIADVARFFSQRFADSAWGIPNFRAGWGKEFKNLLERGMRIRVTPRTRNFIVITREAQRAGIPGISARPSTKFDPGYTVAGITKRDKLTVNVSNPYDLPVPAELNTIFRNAARVLKITFRKLNLKADVTIIPVTSTIFPQIGGQAGASAAMGVTDSGLATIFVNVDKVWVEPLTAANAGQIDTLGVLSNIAHEAGHIILEITWNEIPYKVQDQLLVLAEREFAASRDSSFLQMKARSYSPVPFNTFRSALDQVPGTSDLGHFAYFTSITEIIARAVERYAMGALQTMPRPSKSFLGRQKNRLDELYKAFRDYDKNFMEPPEAIKSWLAYLQSNPGRNSFMGETMAAKLEQSLQRSGDLALPGVEHPETGATVNGRLQMHQIFGTGPGGRGGPPSFWKGFDLAASAVDHFVWLQKKTLAIRELAHQNRVRLPEMGYLADLGFQFNAFINRQQAKHERLMKRGHTLGATKGDKLARLIFYMSEMKYRSAFEQQTKVRRLPTRQEFVAALRRFGIRDQETVDIYNQIRQNFIDYLKMSETALIERARQTFGPNELPGVLDAIQAETQQKLNSPYFPMTRFGDYYIYVRDIHRKVVYAENFPTAEQRDAVKPRIKRDFPQSSGYEVIADMKVNEQLKPFAGYSPRLLEVVKERLNLDAYPELRKQFEVLLYELGPEKSHRKHMLEREGIPGYSQDMWRVYADYFMHGDRALARLMFERAMQEQINNMYGAKSRFSNDRDKDRISRLADFSQGWLNDIMSPAMDFARTKAGMYFWTLAFSPATAAIQLSQLVFSWGHLTKVYGTLAGHRAVTRALGASTKNVRSVLTNMAFDVDPVKRRAREYAYEVSVLRDGLAAEMANVATGSKMSRYAHHSRVGRTIANLSYWGGWMIAAADNFGRHVTFDAAWELAGRDQTWMDKVLENYPDYRMLYNRIRSDPNLSFTDVQAKQLVAGIHAVNTAYFEVGRWSKPQILKGTLSLPFFLMTFTRAMLYFLATQPGGRRTLAIWWLLAGVAGLPFAEDIDNIIKQIAGLAFGQDFSPLKEMQRFLVDTFGEDSVIPSIVTHGLASQSMGVTLITDPLGIPFPHFDISPSLSISRIIPGLADLDLRSMGKPTEVVGEVAQGSGGVPASLLMNAVRWFYSPLDWSDPKGWEMIMPRRLRNATKAIRLGYEGSERTAKGAKVPGTEFDWTDPGDALDLLMLGLGDFTPARIRRAQVITGEQIEAKEFWLAQREKYRGMLYQAFDSGDNADINEMMDAIQAFDANVTKQGHPELSLGNPKQLRQGYMQHLRSQILTEQGQPSEKMFGPLYQELERIYGSGAQVIDQKTVK